MARPRLPGEHDGEAMRPTTICMPDEMMAALKRHAARLKVPYSALLRALVKDGIRALEQGFTVQVEEPDHRPLQYRRPR